MSNSEPGACCSSGEAPIREFENQDERVVEIGRPLFLIKC